MAEAIQRRGLSLDFHTAFLVLAVFGGITTCLEDYKKMPWWTNPCKQPIPPVSDKLRHGRSADNKAFVVNQLNILINKNKEYLNDIEKLYLNKSADSNEVPRSKFRWLNVRKLIRDIEASKGYNARLKRLHNSLQLFGGVLEKLSKIRFKTHGGFNRARRSEVLHETKLHLKAFICEVKEALVSANRTTKNIMLEDMDIPLTSETHHLSDLCMFDVYFFRKMKLFLTQIKKKKLLRRRRIRKRNRKDKVPQVISNNVALTKSSFGRSS